MRFVALIVVLLVFAALIVLRLRGSRPASQNTAQPQDIYRGLRTQALQGTREKFTLPPMTKPTDPWGVLMDLGMERGTATVVAFSDGNASIYLSSGGGYIGGIGHESVRKAAQNMVAVAGEFQSSMTMANGRYPLPKRDETMFYLLTDEGVFTASARQDDLAQRRLPLSKLFDAGQGVITEYRLIDQQ